MRAARRADRVDPPPMTIGTLPRPGWGRLIASSKLTWVVSTVALVSRHSARMAVM